MAVGKGSLARAAEAAEKAAEEKKNMTDEIMADALPEEQEKETMEENRAVLQETEKPASPSLMSGGRMRIFIDRQARM